MKNRYNFAKICYQEYVILILENRKLYSYNEENKLYNFKYINKLKELNIRYKKYYYKYKISKLLDLIVDRRKDGIINEEDSNKYINNIINCYNSNIYN